MTGWFVVFEVLSVLAMASCIVFMFGYDHRTGGSWKRYPMGRHLMGFIAMLGVAFGMLSASLLWGPFGPVWWSLVLFGLNVVIFQRNVLLFTTRWRSRGSDPSDDTVVSERRKG